MEEEVEKCDLLTLKLQVSQTNKEWRHELERHQLRVETLEEKLTEVKASMQGSEDHAQEIGLLWRRVKTAATLLTYLKSKARIMAVPHLAHTSCGISHKEGVGFIDRNGLPMSEWLKDNDVSSFGSSNENSKLIDGAAVIADVYDCVYIGDILKTVNLVTDIMESLVKRVMVAENENVIQKEKVSLGLEENRMKTLQIESMSSKLEEMEKFASGANSILNEMRQKVEDMVQETSRQRQRAADNEQELCRVKQEFESLRSYVGTLISVRETLISSEKQFETLEKLFDRLISKTSHLESEKMQKEAEVQKLMAENVKLTAQLDQKEAQLLAMKEQCKFLALNNFTLQ